MRVIYEGPCASVEVPALGIVAERGVPVEVEDEKVAKALLEQGTWTAPKVNTTKGSK